MYSSIRTVAGTHLPQTSGIPSWTCALDNGVPGIEAQCGGACLCSTCHCYVETPWFGKLSGMIDDERELLTYLDDWRHNSRLSCQVFMTQALDGIVVHVPEKQWRGQ